MARPLYDRITDYCAKTRSRFCMPGHSGESDAGIYACAPFDWTEVSGLDNLLESEDVILQSEKLLAKDYGYAYALMLTCGVTCAMHIALNLAKERGGRVIAVGDMHKSFWSACALYGIDAEVADGEKSIDAAKGKISAIFVTSPDYFGKTKDIKKLREAADEANALLVVDEAHGAHFPYSSLLPDNACKYADIAMTGMHKTLPVYGGGALMLVNAKEFYEKARIYRAMTHSTSPNYLVMASMDYAGDTMRREGEKLYAKVKTAVDEFSANLKSGKVIDSDDFTRVIIEFEGKDCYKLSDELTREGIFVEAAYGDRLVLIVTPFNCDKLKALSKALESIKTVDGEPPVLPVLEHRDVESREVELKDIDCALGGISACDIGLYPPGVPVIKRGDLIDESAVAFIKKYRNRLFGLASGRIAVVK